MESPHSHLLACGSAQDSGNFPNVDPFLVEALQNPRHRLTILRMEMDIQRFMQSADQNQFEFPHFPTSYLRLAAHRVAQHYGLQSMALDNTVDGSGSGIIVRKTTETRYPFVCLSEIPAKQPENNKSEHVKFVIRPRPHKASLNDGTEHGIKRSPVRTVEQRKEEYDKARARIFSGFSSPDLEGVYSKDRTGGRSLGSNRDESKGSMSITDEEACVQTSFKDSAAYKVAIFRDREKDCSDPDYDRSYDRYFRGFTPNQNLSLGSFTILQPPFVQYETGFPRLGPLPRIQTSVGYRPSNSISNPLCTTGLNQPCSDAIYLYWPSPSMMYAHSYEHFRHAIPQPPFHQQPLSFDYSLNH